MVNHSPDDKRDPDTLFAAALLGREFQRALRIGLPKVNARTQPVVRILALLKSVLTGKEPLADQAVATVIAEHEAGGKAMHGISDSSLTASPTWSRCLP